MPGPLEPDDKERLEKVPYPTNINSNTNHSTAKDHDMGSTQSEEGAAQPARTTLDHSILEELERCKAELAALRPDQKSETVARYRVIHRVPRSSHESFDYWHDQPRWVYGEKGAKTLQGYLPISNISTFSLRHPEISFLVYRTYDDSENDRSRDSGSTEKLTDTDAGNNNQVPIPSSESIYIVSEHLRSTCEEMHKLLPYRPSGNRVDKLHELEAPYLSIYHSRDSLTGCASELKPLDFKEWDVLIRYIMDTWGSEYERVDNLISQNQISTSYLQYLFKPNEHMVTRRAGVHVGYLSTEWPIKNSILHRTWKQLIVEELGENLESLNKEWLKLDNSERHVVFDLKAYCIKYNGKFFKNWERLRILRVKKEDGDKAFPINELNIYPLAFAAPEVHALLKKRGEVFWKCRTQQYVT